MGIFRNVKKMLIFFFILNCFGAEIKAQQFEGKIVILSQFESKNLYSNKQYDTTYLLIKGNMLKSWRISSPHTQFFYIDGKEYYINKIDEEIIFDSNSLSTRRKIEKRNSRLRQTKYKEKFNGYNCTKFYYTEKTYAGINTLSFWVTGEWDVGFSWSYYLIKDVGLVMKFDSEYSRYTGTDIVLDILPMKLEDKLFELPNYPIKKVNMEKLSKTYIEENN